MTALTVSHVVERLVRAGESSLAVGVSQGEATKSAHPWQAVVGPHAKRVHKSETVERARAGASKLQICPVGSEAKFIDESICQCRGQGDRCVLRTLVGAGRSQSARQKIVVEGIRVCISIVCVPDGEYMLLAQVVVDFDREIIGLRAGSAWIE